jgi:hypothetical protein
MAFESIHGPMDPKPRLTKQGIRDLNHYGPKPVKAPAASQVPATDAESGVSELSVPKTSDAPPAGEA